MVRIGETARQALARSGGRAAPIAGLADAPYLDAAGELLWVGARLPAMHPRAVVTSTQPPRGVPLRFDSLPPRGWSGVLPALDDDAVARFRAAAAPLREALIACESPRGFGVLLAGRIPDSPLGPAVSRVRALACAYAGDDSDAVFAKSLPLLGLGTGLTPSGDDLAGAAVFARRLVARRDPRWPALAERLTHEIAARSHVVSAALFADLARGQSFEPLHAMAEALAAGDAAAALAAARTLAVIGHSSGWDMLAGFFIGVGGVRVRRL